MPELFNTNTTTASATPVADEAEVVEINWDEEVVAEHPDADMNEILPLPEGGKIYLFKARLLNRGEDKENPYGSMTKDKKPFINVAVELELTDESSPYHGFKINHYLTSLVFERRGTSALHHFMNCIGETLPERISLGTMRDRVKAALDSGNPPMVQAELEWKASIKTGPGKYDWTEVVKKMKDFPRSKESDGYSQIYIHTDPKTRQQTEARANAYISKFVLQGQGS